MDAVNWGKVMQDSSEHGVYIEGLIKTLLHREKWCAILMLVSVLK
jgi:hypothetical protein